MPAAPAHVESSLIEKVRVGDIFFKFVSGTRTRGVVLYRENEVEIPYRLSAATAHVEWLLIEKVRRRFPIVRQRHPRTWSRH